MSSVSLAHSYPYAFAGPRPIMDPKERFYRHFHDEVQDIQDRIRGLGAVAVVGGERKDATDSILASISKLSLEVADASEFVPAYDQRTYSASVKALTDQLNDEAARLTPKARFQFKRAAARTADPSAPHSLAPAAAAADKPDPRLLRGVLPGQEPTPSPASSSSSAALPTQPAPAANAAKDYNAEIAQRPSSSSSSAAIAASAVRKPSFSAAREVVLSGHTGLHIVLPPSAAHATASAGQLTDLRGCVVDLSAPTTATGAFQSLVLRNIDRSLVVAGRVRGAVHVTGLRDSVLVVATHQIRMHECRGVDVYLRCAGRPIIEDCTGLRFAPLPGPYDGGDDAPRQQPNLWDQVDDFLWLRADPSPHWRVLPPDQRLPDAVWTDAVPGRAGLGTEDVLRAVGIPKSG